MAESIAQQKIARLIQREMSEWITLKRHFGKGAFLTVSLVRLTADMGIAKVYVSVLPEDQLEAVVGELNALAWEARKDISARLRNKMRKMPELAFYGDDTPQEAAKIDDLFRKIQEEEIRKGFHNTTEEV
jgi:ribosome-binding factor A